MFCPVGTMGTFSPWDKPLRSLICIFHRMWEKTFEFMLLTFQENASNLSIFAHASVSRSKLQAEFFENLFPATAERDRENYDFLYQNSLRKYENELEH